jgi:hypothetical protein
MSVFITGLSSGFLDSELLESVGIRKDVLENPNFLCTTPMISCLVQNPQCLGCCMNAHMPKQRHGQTPNTSPVPDVTQVPLTPQSPALPSPNSKPMQKKKTVQTIHDFNSKTNPTPRHKATPLPPHQSANTLPATQTPQLPMPRLGLQQSISHSYSFSHSNSCSSPHVHARADDADTSHAHSPVRVHHS